MTLFGSILSSSSLITKNCLKKENRFTRYRSFKTFKFLPKLKMTHIAIFYCCCQPINKNLGKYKIGLLIPFFRGRIVTKKLQL